MLVELAERRLAPDRSIRRAIRRLLAQRLELERIKLASDKRGRGPRLRDLFAAGPIAEATVAARRQHYEAPTELFQAMLGPRLKYSGCLWAGAANLADAEEAMLDLTCRRAKIADGQRILDLGCGWGSLALWVAERYPRCEIVAVSNSATQHEYVNQQTAARGLTNLRHVVGDVATIDRDDSALPRKLRREDLGRFDRIVSVEMFEHLRNVGRLLQLLPRCLNDGGLLFVHIFCHRELFYRFSDGGRDDWMGRHFFTGGAMPPVDLFEHLGGPLKLIERWEIGGEHYARTCRAWLANLDERREAVLLRFGEDLSRGEARRQLQRWRMFLMACEELFASDEGRQWLVSHHLLAVG